MSTIRILKNDPQFVELMERAEGGDEISEQILLLEYEYHTGMEAFVDFCPETGKFFEKPKDRKPKITWADIFDKEDPDEFA